MDKSLRRTAAERDVEQDLTNLGITLAGSELVQDGASLLIARPRKAELLGNGTHQSIRLCNRAGPIVDSRYRPNETSIDPRCALNHTQTVPGEVPNECNRAAPITPQDPPSNSLLLGWFEARDHRGDLGSAPRGRVASRLGTASASSRRSCRRPRMGRSSPSSPRHGVSARPSRRDKPSPCDGGRAHPPRARPRA